MYRQLNDKTAWTTAQPGVGLAGHVFLVRRKMLRDALDVKNSSASACLRRAQKAARTRGQKEPSHSPPLPRAGNAAPRGHRPAHQVGTGPRPWCRFFLDSPLPCRYAPRNHETHLSETAAKRPRCSDGARCFRCPRITVPACRPRWPGQSPAPPLPTCYFWWCWLFRRAAAARAFRGPSSSLETPRPSIAKPDGGQEIERRRFADPSF